MARGSKAAAAAAYASMKVLAASLAKLPPGDRSWMARRLMRERYTPEVRTLAGFFDQALAAWHNRQYDVRLNGEAALLERLAPFAPQVLFDVGANAGDWCLAARRAIPGAALHAFEIDPDTATILTRQLAGLDRLQVNGFGLSDQPGETRIFVQPDVSTSTTMLATGVPGLVEKTVAVATGDAYVREHGIAHIDLLKIDVEGAEPKVLDGFRDCFERRMITMVQFEYGPANLQIRHLLADFHRFFAEQGFVIGKIYPEGVSFGPYAPDDEDFRGPNFLACRSDRPDIIAALRCERLTPL